MEWIAAECPRPLNATIAAALAIPSSVDACKFYEKLGYYYVNDNNPDEDGVVLMKKDLI